MKRADNFVFHGIIENGSPPTRRRGLKRAILKLEALGNVASHAEAWIETSLRRRWYPLHRSPPTRRRGLKRYVPTCQIRIYRRLPRGGVD